MPPCVLLVDDERPILNSLRRVLRAEGYDLLFAQTGEEALADLREREVAVVVCDQNLGSTTGAEVLAEALQIRPSTVRIMLTASTDLNTAQEAINRGRISRFLLKPWDDENLKAVIAEGVHRFQLEQEVLRLHEETSRQRDQLESWARTLEEQVRQRTADLQSAYEETLNALVMALDRREHATAGHSRRVAAYALYFAGELGISSDQFENIYRGAMLHDIGKIGVSDTVLLKPGSLTPEEREAIERHVVMGHELLRDIAYLRPALAIPRYHHERFDGTGYAEGIPGDAIPIEAKAFAIVDAYDALRCERPYKKAMSHERTCEIIMESSGTHFDPSLARVYCSLPEEVFGQLAEMAESAGCFEEVLRICRTVREDVAVPAGSDGSMTASAGLSTT